MKPITKIRTALVVFIVLLILSGITAFPLRAEMKFLTDHINLFPDFLKPWLVEIDVALAATPDLVLYGTDWLAFAHIIIALFFIPVYRDPIKYKANLAVAMVACVAIFLLAFICGPIRGIPFFHQLIDCSFGLIGLAVLIFIFKQINKLSQSSPTNTEFK